MKHTYLRGLAWPGHAWPGHAWRLSLVALGLLFSVGTFAQRTSYTFSGTIRGKSDAVAIPGSSVLVRGTTSGGIADANGQYRFTTSLDPGSYTLVVTSLGYQTLSQEISLGSQTTVSTDFLLTDDAQNLDEIVVIGSTLTSSRRSLGNAISSIKAEDLAKSGTANVFGALQGKVPGAQITQNSGDPAGGITIRLRGVKSLQGSSDPLYVIDGVVVSNASTNVSQLAAADQVGGAVTGQNRLADLNPQDIESINVINGAAAAAIYGSRASNGVVLITTKRGKNGTPRVSFTTSFNVNQLRKKVPVSTYGKQFGFPGLRLYTIGNVTAAQVTGNPGTTTIPVVRDGATANLATNLVDVTRYDYQDNIFRTGYGTDNALSISGGTEKTQYFASVSYLNNQGIIKGTDFKRYGLRLRLDQRLADWAKVSAGLTYTNSFSAEKPNGNVFYSPINSVNITNNIYDITQRDAAGNLLGVEPSRVNPLTIIETFDFTQATSRTINDVQFNLTPLSGLSIDWVLGVDTYSQLGKNYIPPYPYATPAYGLPVERYPQGFAANATNQVLLFNTDLNVSYAKTFGDVSLNATAGLNYQFQRSDFTRASGQNITPFISTVSGASSTTVTAGYGLDRFAVSGQFVQATLGYKNGLFLTAALRRDASTLFSPSQTNQLYPKVSGSWVVSDFLKNSLFSPDAVSNLKVRASFGEAGGVSALGTYDRFYQFNPTAYLGAGTIVPSSRLANPNVRPERMRELEGGLDLGLLNDRIGLTLTAYSQRISDLVVSRTLASSEGGTSITNNVGEMTNKGLEIGLNVTPVKTKDFEWDLTLIYNRNRNKIVSLGSPVITLNNVAGVPAFLIEGMPASVFRGTYFATNPDGSLLLTPQGLPQSAKGIIVAANRLSTTKYTETTLPPGTQLIGGTYYIPDNSTGQPTGQNLQAIIGDPNPKWTGSFSSNLRYKSLNFRFLLDAVQGVQVFNADKRTRQGVGLGDFAEKELRGELPRGYIYAIYNTEAWRIDNGSFVKLREVSLGYTFPKFIKSLSNLTLSVAGRNLISWDNYNGYDPETNAGGNSDRLRGIDFGNVPIPKSYQVSLSASF